MVSANPVAIKLNNDIPITVQLDAGLSGEVNTTSMFYVTWNVDGVDISTEKITEHICTEYKIYEIICTVNYLISGTLQYQSITTITLNLLKPIVFDLRIYNNNGPAPLVFTVEDVTDYSNTGFYPNYWRWKILDYGCVGGEYGVKKRTLTIPNVGQYGIKVMITDGVTWYTVIRDDVIVVTGTDQTGVQIELAHNTGSEIMRHIIKSNNSYSNDEENSISVNVWGTEVATTEPGDNNIFKIRSDEKSFIKSVYPLEDELNDIGTDYERWRNLIFKSLDMRNVSQSKILVLWSGD